MCSSRTAASTNRESLGCSAYSGSNLIAMTISPDKAEFRFEVALSFAGPHREKVRVIAERLSAAIDPGIEDRSKGRVFFDEWFQHEIFGTDMDVLLQRFYHDQSQMVVADLSEDYADRPWTQAEARAIRALRMKLDPARNETERLRLLNVRFGSGDVPGVLNTEGWLDGIDLSAEDIADVILKRRELLRERLGSLKSSTDEPPAIPPKGWVWHSTLASRAADQISVLAVVETVLAIVLYWWIALRFETHWHLVSSVFIAPLLLLRSPESIDAGVRWFMNDSVANEAPENRSGSKRFFWTVVCSLVTTGLTYFFACELSRRWLTDLQGWAFFGCVTAIGYLSIGFAVAVAVTVVGVRVAGDAAERALPVANAGAVAIAPAVLGVVLLASPLVVLGVVTSVVARAQGCRVLATLFNTTKGFRRLPVNWRENNFLTDSCLPAELMPGIRERNRMFSFDGWLKELSEAPNWWLRIVLLLMGIFFVPAFLYRLNIKATAWFWWPLAYLLKPAPAASAEAQQSESGRWQAVCWPWSNPAQRAGIGLSIGLALLALVLHALVATSRIEPDLVTRWPLAARVLLGWGWQRLEVWHWAQGIIAVSGVGMLLLAGNACSQHSNGNWSHYRQSWPQDVRCMTALSRVRLLATVALLVMALGALLLQDPDRQWQAYVPVPANWVTWLEDFYQWPR